MPGNTVPGVENQESKEEKYPFPRKLCGLYFHMQRDGQWGPRCFTDMTRPEQEEAIRKKNDEWLRSMIFSLADTIRKLGDQFDIIGVHPGDLTGGEDGTEHNCGDE